jgi:Fur family transcriptional regulator, ferric uptake regulator
VTATVPPMMLGLDEMVARRLGEIDQRLTAKRSAIVAVLATASRPLTTHEILTARHDLAQSSVYRNLAVLESAGVVHRVVTGGEFARYELAEELTGHHHHLVCTRCGAVEDVPASAAVERSVRAATSRAARQAGFRMQGHRLDVVGHCRDCA